MTSPLERWRRGGEIVRLTVRGTPRRVFVRRVGQGPTLLLLHGFPASSFEWAAIEPELARQHRVISFDFLGYGASAKPPGHRYSVFEQADLAEAIIAAYAPSKPTVIDYGAIVATELLARQPESGAALSRCIFLNAGLFADRYRPRIAQRASLVPVLGALLARVFTEKLFFRTWDAVFSTEHPLDRELAALHYRALRENDPGRDIQRKLLRYIPERAANGGALRRRAARHRRTPHILVGHARPGVGRRDRGGTAQPHTRGRSGRIPRRRALPTHRGPGSCRRRYPATKPELATHTVAWCGGWSTR
ncbi:alpha/beta fold hydrolase [Mycobacterium sherrisii]|uniref:alpha/beta fold hydrolase n=1 Tax=Mycobacterium sherrisii TaxID=243061 RepID=UPI000A076E0F|nr:alpha/beta fold hydrolase [Mycobacterium sherrisii]MCV7028346.1 alpha/beta fold hydrolase [Mycobacterium sherrisii]MEC4765687.1 alpha/beta fold hydrolase [Mycobacterium sherrisii]ORW87393.1 hypothetical protein AWC25_00740 [Mycobacterium sherrisii]